MTGIKDIAIPPRATVRTPTASGDEIEANMRPCASDPALRGHGTGP